MSTSFIYSGATGRTPFSLKENNVTSGHVAFPQSEGAREKNWVRLALARSLRWPFELVDRMEFEFNYLDLFGAISGFSMTYRTF